MKDLTKSEEVILLSVIRLKDRAYGVKIKDQIKRITKRDLVYGTLYSTFEQLVNKGFLEKKFGEPTQERGGKRKLYFQITKSGVSVLKNSLAMQENVWDGITEKVLNGVLNNAN